MRCMVDQWVGVSLPSIVFVISLTLMILLILVESEYKGELMLCFHNICRIIHAQVVKLFQKQHKCDESDRIISR